MCKSPWASPHLAFFVRLPFPLGLAPHTHRGLPGHLGSWAPGLGPWATGHLGTWRRNSSQGSLGSARVSGVGIVVVGVCRGGKKVFRVGTSERASASRGTNPPGFCLTTTRARVITGAETATAADVGIASSCPCLRLSGGTWWPGYFQLVVVSPAGWS